MKLNHLTDTALLIETKHLVKQERKYLLLILYHLIEIEKRRVFADIGYNSLFDYAVNELRYSSPAAARRIRAARLLSRLPSINKKIEQGSLTLSNIAEAATVFQNANLASNKEKEEILLRIENKSSRECGKILAELKSDKIPKEDLRPVTPEFSTWKINVTDKTIRAFDDLKGLLAHKRLSQDELLLLVFNTALAKLKQDKFHLMTKADPKTSESRYIPAAVKKQVYVRDQGRCQNCKGTYKLEFDHIQPFAMGGKTSAENLRLLCFSCNQRQRIKNGMNRPGVILAR